MQLGFGAVAALVVVVGVIGYRSVISATDSAQWSVHALKDMEQIEDLRLAMEKVSSGYRDYAFSGEDEYLQQAEDNGSIVDRKLGSLRLAQDDPAQQHRLGQLTDVARDIVTLGESSARLRRARGDGHAVDPGFNAKFETTALQFHALAIETLAEEHRLLRAHVDGAGHSYRETKAALVVGSLVAFLIAAVSGWMVPRQYTERIEAADVLRRLNRLYAMVSGINALGVRVRDLDELFSDSCRIAVEHGEFATAWIGILDAGGSLVPQASAGIDEKMLAAITALLASSDGSLQGKTMAAQAIRGAVPVVSNDVPHDQSLIFGREHAASGVRSIAMLPLIVGDKVIGVFVLYASQLQFFDAPGLQLLTEVAGNIAFTIDNISKQQRFDRFAHYDPLTGLANRSLFLDRLTEQMGVADGAGHRLAILLIDLERFKKFNDGLGRPAGDALLVQVAAWLVEHSGNVNLAARIGSDQFFVIFPEVMYETEVVQRLEVLMAAFLGHPFNVKGVEYRIAAKAGVALFPEDGTDAETLFNNAEAALKKAKAGRDRYLFFAQQMTDTVTGMLSIENRLRLALENHEFVLHYQPKVNLRSGLVTGAEALIRWNDPRTGLVPPGRFIPVLEETGLIHDVGRWALHQAIQDYRRWYSAGLPALRIAVNVSPLQLHNLKFVAEVEEAVGVIPNASAGLELELTESLIMENVNHSIAILLALRALGITVAIDDFGTGFSSLSYLSKLPVDTLKIDRSFVVDMTSGVGGLTLVSVIINLAHALKLNVVAEGVETEEQLRQLRLLGCDEMQGFVFGKPVPCEVFEKRYLTPVSRVRAHFT
jgi:diguanylate cyclase (GGDEF)-like protein